MKPCDRMSSALKAGALYFALIFLVGFILGVARTLALAPVMGETLAVLAELPFILVVSWLTCRWIVNLLLVQNHAGARIIMGISALLMLLAAEAMLSVGLSGLSLPQHFALYLNPAAQLGLLGQLIFALFPLIQLKFPVAQ